MQLLNCNSGIHQFQTHEVKQDLQGSGKGADSDSICKAIDAKDEGTTVPCGLLAAMDSAPTLNGTSLMQPL